MYLFEFRHDLNSLEIKKLLNNKTQIHNLNLLTILCGMNEGYINTGKQS